MFFHMSESVLDFPAFFLEAGGEQITYSEDRVNLSGHRGRAGSRPDEEYLVTA